METKAKFTPGPWTVDGPPSNLIVWSSAENRVCFLAHSNGLDDDRDIATGLLIAAAPDLLEAAKAAKKFLETDLVEPGRTVFWKLVDAIAKAEGR